MAGVEWIWRFRHRNPVRGRPGERLTSAMQKFVDKWFLPFLFVVIGGVIVWGVWRGFG